MFEGAIYDLERKWLPLLRGECARCGEPCKYAWNGLGHENECPCHEQEDDDCWEARVR